MLTTLTISVYFAVSETQKEIEEKKIEVARELDRVFSSLQNPIKIAILSFDEALADEILSGLLLTDFIKKATIIDDYGNVLSEKSNAYGTKDSRKLLTFILGETIREKRQNISFSVGDTSSVGEFILVYDYHQPFLALFDSLYKRIIITITELFLIVLVYLGIFYYLVMRPLSQLKTQVKGLNIQGSEDFILNSIETHEKDEIGELIDVFNKQFAYIHTLFEENEKALRNTEASFDTLQSLIETLPHLIIVHALDKTILFVNKAFTKEFGFSAEELLGKSLNDAIYANNDSTKKVMDDANEEVVKTQQPVLIPEVTWQVKNGNYITIEMRKLVIQFRGSPAILTVGVDVTERKEHQARIQHMAYHDSLTSLPNRHLFIDRLEQALLRAQRSERYGALIFVDLDNFKEINDSKGHFAGDTLLTGISKRLKEIFRDEDTVARLGGDEFVVCMTDLGKSKPEAKVVVEDRAERLLKSLEKPFIIENASVQIGASLGIAFFHNHDASASELLGYADMAMYKAKEAGKNQIMFFEKSMAESIARTTELKEDSRRAIDEDEFYLVYQPQVHAVSNKIIGAESLLRWNHPTRGLISPAEFIPLLEDIELMPEVGTFVLKTALKQTKEWLLADRIDDSFKISINVSPQQFRMSNFPVIVNDIIERYEVPPFMVDLEITESMIIDNIDYTVAAMKELRSTGVHFSIDDFGTGYSNLNYLKKLPLDVLKVDQSFVRDILSDPNDTAIVRTILAMANQLNLRTIAEGVETPEQLASIKEMGCHVYQGYLYSPPVTSADFERLLNENYEEMNA
ncbi:EAL domain-containing protein [Reinekea forsetii]|nr:EAL domain-containing protein [Reinekea forsetii]